MGRGWRAAADAGGLACECTRCGDGIVQDGQNGRPGCGEQCEPTGPNDPDCSQSCQLTPHCGDGTCNVAGESCDGASNCTTTPPGGAPSPGATWRHVHS